MAETKYVNQAERLKALYGEDYFKKIGAKGGANGTTGGFYNNPELASRAGKIGGKAGKKRG